MTQKKNIFLHHKMSDNLCRPSKIITNEEKNVITHHQDLIEAVTESVLVQMLLMKQFTPTLKSGSLSLSLSLSLSPPHSSFCLFSPHKFYLNQSKYLMTVKSTDLYFALRIDQLSCFNQLVFLLN